MQMSDVRNITNFTTLALQTDVLTFKYKTKK